MDEAAPQAAAGTAASAQALEALRWDWGQAYLIGRDDERGWWASRRDEIGGLLTADDPDGLRRQIRGDYTLRPVPRAGGEGDEPKTAGWLDEQDDVTMGDSDDPEPS